MSEDINRIKVNYAAQTAAAGSRWPQFQMVVLASTKGDKSLVSAVFQRTRSYYYRGAQSSICRIEQVAGSPEAAVALAKRWASAPLEAVALIPPNVREREELERHLAEGKITSELSGDASGLPGWNECAQSAKNGKLPISLALGQALDENVPADGPLPGDIEATLSYYLESVPFQVGHWGSFKRLIKQLEGQSKTSELFGRALARIDSGAIHGKHIRGSAENLSMLAPFLPDRVASKETLAYLARRGRRFLRRQSKESPATYCQLAGAFLRAADDLGPAADISRRWILSDVLYGRGTKERSHGRGTVELPAGHALTRRRWDRAPHEWNNHIHLVQDIWASVTAISEIQTWAFAVLRSQKQQLSPLSIGGIGLALLNSHKPIRRIAQNQLAANPAQFFRLDRAAAVAFLEFSTGKQFNSVYEAFESHPNVKVAKEAVSDFLNHHGMQLVLRGESAAKHTPRVRKLLSFTLRHAREEFSDSEILNLALHVGETDRFKSPTLWEDTFRALPLRVLIELRLQLPRLPFATKVALDEACKNAALSGTRDETLATALVHSPSRGLRELAWQLLITPETNAETFATVWRSLADHAADDAGTRRLRESIQVPTRLQTLVQNEDAAKLLSVVSIALAGRHPRVARKTLRYLASTEDAPVIVDTLAQFSARIPDWSWLAERSLLTRLVTKAPGVLALIWKGLGESRFDALVDQIRVVPSSLRPLLDLIDPNELLRINSAQAGLFKNLLLAWPARLTQQRALAIASATCPAGDVSVTAIALLEARGAIKDIFMPLLESQLPAALDSAERYVRRLPPGPALSRALITVCDSGVKEVRAVGLKLLSARQGDYDSTIVYTALAEHKAPEIAAEVARYVLRGGKIPRAGIRQFDNRILRTRRHAREAKELVKKRIAENTEQTFTAPKVANIIETERVRSLLAMARGSSIRDREWAFQELARLTELGIAVPSIKVSRTS